jgi:hypothetical protein
MTETPNIWDVGEDIPFELFFVDPVTNLGRTGQVAYITLSIKRLSDNTFWNGASWVAGFAPLSVTEPDDTNEPGRYTYVLSGSVGNTQADIYVFRVRINNPSIPFTGENYEQHKSRTQSVVVIEGEPSM